MEHPSSKPKKESNYRLLVLEEESKGAQRTNAINEALTGAALKEVGKATDRGMTAALDEFKNVVLHRANKASATWAKYQEGEKGVTRKSGLFGKPKQAGITHEDMLKEFEALRKAADDWLKTHLSSKQDGTDNIRVAKEQACRSFLRTADDGIIEVKARQSLVNPDPDSAIGKLTKLRDKVKREQEKVERLLHLEGSALLGIALQELLEAVQGTDHVAIEGLCLAMENQVETFKRDTKDIAALEQAIGSMSNRVFMDKTMAGRQSSAAAFKQVGNLKQAKKELTLLKEQMELFDPDARKKALDALEVELSSMGQAINLMPDGEQGALRQRMHNAYHQVTIEKNLEAARSEVQRLRVDLDPLASVEAQANPYKRVELAQALLDKALKAKDAKLVAELEDLLAHAQKAATHDQSMAALERQIRDTSDQNSFGSDATVALDRERLQQIMQTTGLTEGEILAIRRYTGPDYTVINPSIANQRDHKEGRRQRVVDKDGKVLDEGTDWMDQIKPGLGRGQLKDYEADFPDYRSYKGGRSDPSYVQAVEDYEKKTTTKNKLYEKGAMLAAYAMEAMKKLPAQQGQTFRGMRMTLQRFEAEYQVGKTFTTLAFSSQSRNRGEAEKYAMGVAGSVQPKPDETTHVLITAEVTEGRDVIAMSAYQNEDEWTMLPGSSYVVESIDKPDHGDMGDPPATAWRYVFMRQIA